MHLFIAGASGRTGSKITAFALEAGHEVTTLTHPSGIDIQHPNLEQVLGEINEPEKWAGSIYPGTVVVSAISDTPLLTDAAMQLTDAAEKGGASRIILIGGAGSLKLENGTLYREQPGFPEIFQKVSATHLRAAHIVEKSKLSWTVFCPPDIKQGERTRQYRTQTEFLLPDTSWISFDDLADALVKCIGIDTFHHQRVAISY